MYIILFFVVFVVFCIIIGAIFDSDILLALGILSTFFLLEIILFVKAFL